MAATKFSVIWETPKGIKITELPSEYNYKIALNVAEGIQQINPEPTKRIS